MVSMCYFMNPVKTGDIMHMCKQFVLASARE